MASFKVGVRLNNSELQTREERGGRAARQQPYQTQSTGAAAATEAVTSQWVCTVTTGAATEAVTSQWVCTVITGAATEAVTPQWALQLQQALQQRLSLPSGPVQSQQPLLHQTRHTPAAHIHDLWKYMEAKNR